MASHGGGLIIPFSVEFEQELLDLEQGQGPEALAKYKEENPTHVSALPRILKQGYKALQVRQPWRGRGPGVWWKRTGDGVIVRSGGQQRWEGPGARSASSGQR